MNARREGWLESDGVEIILGEGERHSSYAHATPGFTAILFSASPTK